MDGILIASRGAALDPARSMDAALNRLTSNPDRFDDDDNPDARADAEQAADVAEWKRDERAHWRACWERVKFHVHHFFGR